MSGPARDDAARLDDDDPLAPLADRYATDGRPGHIYLDGNSLGRPTADMAARAAARLEEWRTRLVAGWPGWIDLPLAVGDALAPLIGARGGEVAVCDSTTVNLYKLADAVLAAGPAGGAIAVPRHEFPTDRYVLAGLAARRGVELRLMDCADEVPSPAEAEAACAARDVALLVTSQVAYRSGARADVAAVTAAAARGGTTVVWDLSHSAGSVPVGLDAAGAALAVGATYKYLGAGPGAPAFLYVRRELQARLRSPIQGWFGADEQFAMGPDYRPREGVARFLAGTPGVLALEAVAAGAEPLLAAGIDALAAKTATLTALAIDLHDAWLEPLGFDLRTPRHPARRGAHVALARPDAWPICQALAARAGVVADFRAPDVLRLGFAPASTRHVDVWDALDRLRRLVEAGEQRAFSAAPGRVT